MREDLCNVNAGVKLKGKVNRLHCQQHIVLPSVIKGSLFCMHPVFFKKK